MSIKRLMLLAAATIIATGPALARDAARPTQTVPGQTNPYAVANPYASPAPAAPSTGDRAADAYATGFAIGLGTALINKQREDEAKRAQDAPRR